MNVLLDTRSVAAADRPEYWSAGIAAHFFPVGLDAPPDHAFGARLAGARVGAVEVRSIAATGHGVNRTGRQVADADPGSVLLYLLRAGSCRIGQDGRRCELAPGDLALQDTSRPSTVESEEGMDLVVFAVPKSLLGARGNGLADRTARRFGAGEEHLVRLAVPFLAGLAHLAEDTTIPPDEGEGLADLLVTMVGALQGRADGAPGPDSRELMLGAMRSYALERLHEPTLGPEQIARAHYVSTRYVHKLFAASGSGVAAWIREQRLERARADLRSSAATVASIASRWGYRDAASFSRVFRKTYGHAPSTVRAAAHH